MKKTILLFGIVLGAAALLAGPAPAKAAFMYDLTFSDGSKVKTVAPNTTYTLYLWAEITGDTTLNNDAWTFGYVSLDPTKVGAGAMYNPGNATSVGITGTTTTSHLSAAMISSPGAQNTFLTFADNVKGWGGNSGASAQTTGWMEWAGGGPPGYVGGVFDAQSVQVGPNGQEVLAAIYTLQTGASVNTNGTVGDMTTFNVRTQATIKSGPIVSLKAIDYYNDNPTLQNPTPTGQITDFSNVTFGSPVELIAMTAPEPATAVLLMTGALTALGVVRFRRRSAKQSCT